VENEAFELRTASPASLLYKEELTEVDLFVKNKTRTFIANVMLETQTATERQPFANIE
jgi:hypothetical protein